MTRETEQSRHARVVRTAAELVTKALDVLDAYGAVPEATEHLAIAQDKLKQELARLGG